MKGPAVGRLSLGLADAVISGEACELILNWQADNGTAARMFALSDLGRRRQADEVVIQRMRDDGEQPCLACKYHHLG